MEVVKRNELHTFVVLPKRWVVERSFAWAGKVPPTLEELRKKAQYQPANGGACLHGANPKKIVDRLSDLGDTLRGRPQPQRITPFMDAQSRMGTVLAQRAGAPEFRTRRAAILLHTPDTVGFLPSPSPAASGKCHHGQWKGPIIPSELREVLDTRFKEAVRYSHDYETVFIPDEADFGYTIPFLSPTAPEDWTAIVERIEEFDFSNLDFDVIGQMYGQLISLTERRRFGQFYTSPDVVDLINAFCIRNPDDQVLDPACGGGTFLVRAYYRKRELSGVADDTPTTHEKLLGEIFGVDIAAFPAQLSTINLAVRHLSDQGNYPRVAKASFFDAQSGIPLYDIPLTGDSVRSIALRDLDAIVGKSPVHPPRRYQSRRKSQIQRALSRRVARADCPFWTIRHIRPLFHPRGPLTEARRIPGFCHQRRLARYRLRVPTPRVLFAQLSYRGHHRIPSGKMV